MKPLVFLSEQNEQTTAIQSIVVSNQSQCASGNHHWCCLSQKCEKCTRRMCILGLKGLYGQGLSETLGIPYMFNFEGFFIF